MENLRHRCFTAPVAAAVVMFCGCSPADTQHTETPPGPAAAGIPAEWLGKWNGPEGTYLDIASAQGAYVVTIADLDGPKTFAAVATEGGLTFERNGMPERIHATDGEGTGMKWLAEKTRCLTVKPGEGFCRD